MLNSGLPLGTAIDPARALGIAPDPVAATPATFRIRPRAVTVYAPERRPASRSGATG
ncbi:hypothetical protein [Azospirillum sp. B2RO_4]|uniref:hypothetical protein n=1 Tax=Azospirillum sp. B2RO_4 TaxID=3027796 RepID=UPI003DA9E94E